MSWPPAPAARRLGSWVLSRRAPRGAVFLGEGVLDRRNSCSHSASRDRELGENSALPSVQHPVCTPRPATAQPPLHEMALALLSLSLAPAAFSLAGLAAPRAGARSAPQMADAQPEGFGASHTSFYTDAKAKDSYDTLDTLLASKMADAKAAWISMGLASVYA